jgi:glycosyltransferase involved in cell wall biosynthesis
MNQPLVSVLMTAYNRENFIADAIESVLSSSYENFELIISDDCSKDRTVEIANSYAAQDARIKVFINTTNLGDYQNRNKAASYANGTYIKYLDSDDMMYPYTLQIMVSYMEQFPDAGFGLCAPHEPGKPYPIAIEPRQAYLEHFFSGGHFLRAPGSSIIRKECFDKIGGFTGKRMIGDFQLWLALGRSYKMVKVPPFLVWDREHSGQESKSDYAKLYEKLRQEAIADAFANPGCPLTQTEKDEIWRSISKQKRRNRVYRLIKKFMR